MFLYVRSEHRIISTHCLRPPLQVSCTARCRLDHRHDLFWFNCSSCQFDATPQRPSKRNILTLRALRRVVGIFSTTDSEIHFRRYEA